MHLHACPLPIDHPCRMLTSVLETGCCQSPSKDGWCYSIEEDHQGGLRPPGEIEPHPQESKISEICSNVLLETRNELIMKKLLIAEKYLVCWLPFNILRVV